MVTIWDAYTLMNQCVNNTRGGGLTPEEATSFLDTAQQAVCDKYWEQGIGPRQSPSEALNPLKKPDDLTTDATGRLTIPMDFWHLVGLRDRVSGERIDVVNDTELGDARKSQLRPIAKYKRYYMLDGVFQIVPEALTGVHIIYYRRPIPPKIGYNLDVNDSPAYDAENSIQLSLNTTYWFEIIRQALLYAGVNLSLESVSALAQVPSGGAAAS